MTRADLMIREIGVGAVALRALVFGLLAGAVFDEPIDRGVIAAALGALALAEGAHWARLYFRRKDSR